MSTRKTLPVVGFTSGPAFNGPTLRDWLFSKGVNGSVLELARIAFALEDSAKKLHPHLSLADWRNFWRSSNVAEHVAAHCPYSKSVYLVLYGWIARYVAEVLSDETVQCVDTPRPA